VRGRAHAFLMKSISVMDVESSPFRGEKEEEHRKPVCHRHRRKRKAISSRGKEASAGSWCMNVKEGLDVGTHVRAGEEKKGTHWRIPGRNPLSRGRRREEVQI